MMDPTVCIHCTLDQLGWAEEGFRMLLADDKPITEVHLKTLSDIVDDLRVRAVTYNETLTNHTTK